MTFLQWFLIAMVGLPVALFVVTSVALGARQTWALWFRRATYKRWKAERDKS
ncbi:MAG: hypothetical protein AAGI11_15035 [Pseudomonadota bacterium]